MIQKSEMITQAEIDWLAKLAKSAGNGGYVLDYNGEPCFDGDEVRVDTVDGTEIARLCYDKELRRWYFFVSGIRMAASRRSRFRKALKRCEINNETEEKKAGA